MGASLEEIEEEEEDAESVASGVPTPTKEGCYEIIGTLKDKANPKPDFVKEIIDVSIELIPDTVCCGLKIFSHYSHHQLFNPLLTRGCEVYLLPGLKDFFQN